MGFDTRDNFDDSVPVVADFLLISEEFQSSPSPIYVVVEGDIVSQEGWQALESVVSVLGQDQRVTVVVSDLTSIQINIVKYLNITSKNNAVCYS